METVESRHLILQNPKYFHPTHELYPGCIIKLYDEDYNSCTNSDLLYMYIVEKKFSHTGSARSLISRLGPLQETGHIRLIDNFNSLDLYIGE